MPKQSVTEFNQEESQGFDQILGSQVEQEQTETENSEESSTETNQEQAEESSSSETKEESKIDDNVPFHQHPRWKEVYQKAKKVDELEAQLTELRTQKAAPQPTQETSAKPKWFTDVYGADNEAAWQDYNQYQSRIVSEAESRAVERIKAEQKAEQEQFAKSNAFIENEVQRLKESGHSFDKNKLMKVISDYRPIDSTGTMWDFDKAIEIYNLIDKKPSAEAKKRVAAQTTAKGSTETDEQEVKVYTPSKLREKYGYR